MSRKDDLIAELEDGAQSAKNADVIENNLGMDVGRTNEPTRQLITDCILNDKYPIGSANNGYFLIDSEAELDDVVDSLEGRIQGLRNRIDALREGWRKRVRSRADGNNWPK
jgi:hypothetical protein